MKRKLREGFYVSPLGKIYLATEWCRGGWYFEHKYGDNLYGRDCFSMWRDYLLSKCEFLGEYQHDNNRYLRSKK